jgi:tRNA-(ms[2]io[6]A)-hydroxylase
MLCLQNSTNSEWITVASAHLDDILIDHAHCEKKAAANAMSMVQRYPDKHHLVLEMIAILKEEWEHFELCFDELQRRKVTMTRDKGDFYVQELAKLARRHEPERCLDLLLIDALIEARSCERFSILSKCEDIPEDLRKFYYSLLASEAGHYRMFTDLAREYFPHDVVKTRLTELSTAEAEIIRTLPNTPTIHG